MIYRLILALRHFAYDKGWKKTFQADVPTLCIGNVTVGGTGKTPHTELILRKLLHSDQWAYRNLAVLSRGYKRKSRGFQLVTRDSSAAFAGDEPLQLARKFPAVTVAVDKNRVRGCQLLASGAEGFPGAKKKADAAGSTAAPGNRVPAMDLIVLDDAFQYRRLEATLNIVLVDWNRPVYQDKLLPWGRLRDLPSRLQKAQIVMVTKGPADVDEWTRQEWRRRLKLSAGQQLFFTTVTYDAPEPVFPEADPRYTYSRRLVLVSGIANDAPLRSYLSDTYKIARRLAFPDHHRFTRADMRKLRAAIRENPTACLMTTEKDAQRLRDVPKVPAEIRQRLFCLPIQARFLSPEEDAAFTELVQNSL